MSSDEHRGSLIVRLNQLRERPTNVLARIIANARQKRTRNGGHAQVRISCPQVRGDLRGDQAELGLTLPERLLVRAAGMRLAVRLNMGG